MARKRKISIEVPPPPPEKEVKAEEPPERFQEQSWKEWFTTVYARFWYFILCLFISLTGILWVKWTLMQSWDLALLFPFILLPVEVYVYLKLWGKNKRRKKGR